MIALCFDHCVVVIGITVSAAISAGIIHTNILAYHTDKLNNSLCHLISGSRLCAEDKGGGRPVGQLALLDAEVDRHDRESVDELSLVLVESLNLNVKDSVGVNVIAVHLFDVLGKLNLLLLLDIVELCDELTYQFDGFAYELKNCVRGSFTDANTPDELANYLENLKAEIESVVNQLREM